MLSEPAPGYNLELARGSLAQPAERVVHTDEVTGSSPVPPTVDIDINALFTSVSGAFAVLSWLSRPGTACAEMNRCSGGGHRGGGVGLVDYLG